MARDREYIRKVIEREQANKDPSSSHEDIGGPYLALVEWVDSSGCASEWSEIGDVSKTEPSRCESVGWVYVAEGCVVVVPHRSINAESPQGCGDMTIPESAITKINKLSLVNHVNCS